MSTITRLGLKAACLLVCAGACGGGNGDGDAANGGTGGASGAGNGGSAVAGTGGSSDGGTAGTGTAGNGGSASVPPCPTDRAEFSADDVSLSLGGLNDDLPDPARNCLEDEAGSYLCIALSAVVNGTTREIICASPGITLTDGTAITCSTAANESMGLNTRNFGGTTPPSTFTVTQTGPTASRVLQLQLAEGDFDTDDVNFVEARLAGWVNQFESTTYCRSSSWGSIAATWAAGDAGSGELRVRGTFHTRSF